MSTIPERLAKVRADWGVSVREFAERLKAVGYDVSYGSVQLYEKEDAKVPAEYLAAVCRAFEKSPAWLLMDVGPEDYFEPTEAQKIIEQARQLFGVRPGGGRKID